MSLFYYMKYLPCALTCIECVLRILSVSFKKKKTLADRLMK